MPADIAIDPATLSDAELIAAYQRTDGACDDDWCNALAAELERRNLDI